MRVLVFILALFVSSTALAEPPVTQEEFPPQEHLVLSQAVLLETGWKHYKEQVAVAFVLVKRWRRNTIFYPLLSDQAIAYCPGMRAKHKRRQKWIRQLDLVGTMPNSFPRHLKRRWGAKYRILWLRVLENMEEWALGNRKDPFRGQAWHWRGRNDPPTSARLLPANKYFNFGNLFYRNN